MPFKKFFAKFWHIFDGLHGWVIAVTLSVTLVSVGYSAIPLFRGWLVDGLIAGEPFSWLLWLLVAWAGAQLFFKIWNTINWIWRDRLWIKMAARMYGFAYGESLKFSVGQHVSENSGVKAKRIERGVDHAESLVEIFMMNFLPNVINIVSSAAFLFLLSWEYGAFGLAIILSQTVFLFISFRWMRPKMIKQEKMWREMGRFEWEIWHNIDIVKQNAKEKVEQRDATSKITKIWNYINYIWNRYALMNFGNDFVAIILDIVMIGWAIWSIVHGGTTVGDLVVALAWVGIISSNINQLNWTQQRFARNYAAASELFEMLEIPPAIVCAADAPRLEMRGQVEFCDVSFEYQKNKPALQNVSFTIEPGEKVAFVGESGSGKTTITRLLLRYYDPQNGQIKIDGHDLRDIDLESFMQQTGVVAQDVRLFDDTLEKNIIYGLPPGQKATKQQLEKVVKQARVDKFWERLTKGFQTMLGENGIKLSGGEKQRVSIARALIKNPKLLIFDEATSSLDVESESEIQEAMADVARGRTTIIIAHRLSTVIGADRIFVMKKGKLVGSGKYSELMKTNKYFARLMKIQVLDLIRHNFPTLEDKQLEKILRDLKIL